MSQFPLIKKLKDNANQYNPFLGRSTEDNIAEFLWPTTEHGAYFRVTAWTMEEYEKIVKENIEQCIMFHGKKEDSFFGNAATDSQILYAITFLAEIQSVFFKEPVINIDDYDVKHTAVGISYPDPKGGMTIPKGEICLGSQDGFIYCVRSCNYQLMPVI